MTRKEIMKRELIERNIIDVLYNLDIAIYNITSLELKAELKNVSKLVSIKNYLQMMLQKDYDKLAIKQKKQWLTLTINGN